jgi:hypothetical protein
MIKGLLYNVQAIDPVAFIGIPLLLVGVAAMAVYLPARRAGASAPALRLRSTTSTHQSVMLGCRE